MLEDLTQAHIDVRELVLELFFESFVGRKIKLPECIFNVAEKRMLLEHFGVIFKHGISSKLCLLSFLFIFSWVLGIFVVPAISVSVHTDLEKLAPIVIRSR